MYDIRRPLLIAVDFDGTIADGEFPDIGPPLPGAFETMRDLAKAGHRLILHTCRTNSSPDGRNHLDEAVAYCAARGVQFRSVNANHEEDWYYPGVPNGPKPMADVYIDDKNLGGFPGWDTVRKLLLGGVR